jgi:hypothetical protein
MLHIKLFEEYNTKPIIDTILDKINKTGYNSLTNDEILILNQMDDIKTIDEPKKIEYQQKEFNKKYYDSTKKICFVLSNIDKNINTDEIYFYGNIYFRNNIYYGYISYDIESESFLYEFIDKNDNEFEPMEYNLHYEFDKLIQKIIYDDEIKK